jgi:hypothetical protein
MIREGLCYFLFQKLEVVKSHGRVRLAQLHSFPATHQERVVKFHNGMSILPAIAGVSVQLCSSRHMTVRCSNQSEQWYATSHGRKTDEFVQASDSSRSCETSKDKEVYRAGAYLNSCTTFDFLWRKVMQEQGSAM